MQVRSCLPSNWPDCVVATTLDRPHEPHQIRLEHLQRLPVDAWKHARDQPARTAQLHDGNQRFLLVQRYRTLVPPTARSWWPPSPPSRASSVRPPAADMMDAARM